MIFGVFFGLAIRNYTVPPDAQPTLIVLSSVYFCPQQPLHLQNDGP